MEITHNKNGSMQYNMQQAIPPGTSSSFNSKKTKPSGKGTSKGRRSLTPKKTNNNKKKQYTNWIKGQKSKQSLNSSWYSKSSKRSYNSRSSYSSNGTKYSSLSNKKNNNKQYPQICRYWKKSKCSKEECEFAHYEFKHLNTTYNETLKEGAKHINQYYQKNIEEGKILTQITQLQYLTIEQIERIMKKTDCYKEEIQIAVVNKSAFKRFKKEYRDQLKVLDDDTYNNKIQQKFDVFKQQLDQIVKFDKKKSKLNTQLNQSAQQQITQNSQLTHQPNQDNIEEKRAMDIEIQNYQQSEKTQKKNRNETSKDEQQKGRQANRVKSIEKRKNNNNINSTPKTILKNSIETNLHDKKNIKTNNKIKQQSLTPQNPMIINQSPKFNTISTEELQRSETMVNKVSYVSMNHLSDLAVKTQQNQGIFPNDAVQRLFPTIMTTNAMYNNYMLSYIDMNPENILMIANHLNANTQITNQIQAVILFDSVLMYIFKLSEMSFSKGLTQEERMQKVEAYIYNVAILIVGKIKIVLNQTQLGIERTTPTAMAQILMESFSDNQNTLYRKHYIINIGTEDIPVIIAVEIANTQMVQDKKKNKSKEKKKSVTEE